VPEFTAIPGFDRSVVRRGRICLANLRRVRARSRAPCESSPRCSSAPPDGRHRALSAGSEADPDGHVHPQVVEVMRELGIDLADRVPQLLTRELAEQADVVVTMGCGDECPYIPGKRYIDWELADPKGRPIDEVRATRDDIARRVDALVAELDREKTPA
jgi:protein-tyrosine-phosphatase